MYPAVYCYHLSPSSCYHRTALPSYQYHSHPAITVRRHTAANVSVTLLPPSGATLLPMSQSPCYHCPALACYQCLSLYHRLTLPAIIIRRSAINASVTPLSPSDATLLSITHFLGYPAVTVLHYPAITVPTTQTSPYFIIISAPLWSSCSQHL